jgi:2',3'-cyclic-nucleotide 2'-phosphodiesterase
LNKKLKVLFIGDIVGKPGMDTLAQQLPILIKAHGAELVIVNGENVADGKGLDEEQANEIFGLGVDIITTGNHIWDNWKSRPLLAKNDRVLRPMNYPSGNPGKGFNVFQIKSGLTVAVLQLQGRTFMQSIDCPFKAADYALSIIKEKTDIIIVDFHADATSEKVTMGWHLDGKVTAIFGTHTHIPTADATILPNGTAYITDVGMTGAYDSVLGMRKDVAIKRYTLQTAHKFEIADANDVHLCGVCVTVDAETGQSYDIKHIISPPFQRSVFDSLM